MSAKGALSSPHSGSELIEKGNIMVNSQRAKSALKLQTGDRVEILIPPPYQPLTPKLFLLNYL